MMGPDKNISYIVYICIYPRTVSFGANVGAVTNSEHTHTHANNCTVNNQNKSPQGLSSSSSPVIYYVGLLYAATATAAASVESTSYNIGGALSSFIRAQINTRASSVCSL